MKSIIPLFLIAVAVAALASDTTPPPLPPTVKGEIVVTASALPETVESTPAGVTVITKKEIEQQGDRDVADVLREVPGMVLSRTGSQGRATSLFTRGANSTHTLVLWNGIEINNPYFAGYDWGRFSTAGVEQVEVVRGPYSALYGSDAVAGVVNVLTAPTRSSVGAAAELGGHGLRNLQAAVSYVDRGQSLSASVERRVDDGFAPNDDFAQNSANVLWRWTSADRFTIGVAARGTSYRLGIPFDLNATATALVPTPQRRQRGNELQLAVPISQSFGTFGYELTLSESRRRDDFHDPRDPFGLVDQSTDSTARRVRFTTNVKTFGGTLVAGGELSRATVNDASTYGVNLANDRRTERSVFAEDRLSFGSGASRVEISGGARYDRFDTFGSQISPRIAAAWIVGQNKLRAAYGEAFRAPSVGELYYPFSGNRDLRPERSRSAEIGYDHAIGTSGALSATLFRGRYRDLIVFDNATYAFANVGRARTQGIEIAIAHDVLPSLHAALSYTYLDARDDQTARQPLLRRPRNSGSLVLTYRRGAADTSLVVLHSGRRDDIMPVAPFSRVSDRAHTTVDANVQMHFERFTPYVKIENATDTKYEEVRGYPSPRRRAIVGVRFAM